jgi:hypothetical protein
MKNVRKGPGFSSVCIILSLDENTVNNLKTGRG